MTTSPARKISISVPADVAAVLDREENASAYITKAIRERRRREETAAMLREAGYLVTEDRVLKIRGMLAERDARRAASR